MEFFDLEQITDMPQKIFISYRREDSGGMLLASGSTQNMNSVAGTSLSMLTCEPELSSRRSLSDVSPNAR